MEVITIESGAYNSLVGMFETITTTVTKLAEENKKLKDNRLMGVDEVAAYVGFSPKWVHQRKEAIGYFQDGKDIKIYKDDIDTYVQKNFIKQKYK